MGEKIVNGSQYGENYSGYCHGRVTMCQWIISPSYNMSHK